MPCTAAIFALLLLAYPRGPSNRHATIPRLLGQVDILGLGLSLASTVLLVFALQQAGSVYAWSSPVTISILATSVVLVALFVAYEALLPRLFDRPPLPALPLRLFRQRVLVAALTSGFLSGMPFTTALILLPSRYQIVQALSPLGAGLRMLPLLLSLAFGSGLGGVAGRFRNGPFYAVLGGSALVAVAMGLMTTLGAGEGVEGKEYAFLVMLGLGFGAGLSALVVAGRVSVGGEDSGE